MIPLCTVVLIPHITNLDRRHLLALFSFFFFSHPKESVAFRSRSPPRLQLCVLSLYLSPQTSPIERFDLF
jgi:hypothetical protein